MKKLAIVLIEDSEPGKASTVEYMPGDTIAGHVTFNTSSSLKYTCIKIHFVGLISTKIAKEHDDIYVLNQQVVLLGNPTNAEEFTLQDGKHSWPFEFVVPMHQIPSSGKYRHGTVKYNLTATVSSKGFLGSMQDTKTNLVLQLKNLVNCAIAPYADPITNTGSGNIKPDTNKPKNLATATVKLPHSAFMRGQQVNITIDLTHPRHIQRDPGCWILLQRKESYYAGKESREYNHVVTTVAEALRIDSGTNTGKIHAILSIPEDAHPSMTTTRIVSIEYNLYLLFDMRPRTGFMERRSRRTVNKKLRTKILDSPGGFEMTIPIVIGTISDIEHRHRSSPLVLSSSSREASGAIASLTASASQLSISHGSPSSFHSATLDASPRSTPSSPGTWRGQPGSSPFISSSQYIPTTQYMPMTPLRPGGTSGHITVPAPYGRKLSEPGYHTLRILRNKE
ncbi:Arrestin domain-containing protein 1 [Mortierella sp. NVP85]|nr:Arrestin domain-containing protein 1 [Mortierella sp. NVP85]